MAGVEANAEMPPHKLFSMRVRAMHDPRDFRHAVRQAPILEETHHLGRRLDQAIGFRLEAQMDFLPCVVPDRCQVGDDGG